MTALRVGESQELVELEPLWIVSGRFRPSSSVPHDTLLQRARHVAVLLVVRAHVTLGESVRSEKVRVILFPRDLA